eukprot:GHVO01068597.1.p1 GENE.GHVO01068597.1~~GHVO01068597.1.p1  ORF type:complete len:303 (+),score=76.64 GHVO01068597.1:166-1074(+)
MGKGERLRSHFSVDPGKGLSMPTMLGCCKTFYTTVCAFEADVVSGYAQTYKLAMKVLATTSSFDSIIDFHFGFSSPKCRIIKCIWDETFEPKKSPLLLPDNSRLTMSQACPSLYEKLKALKSGAKSTVILCAIGPVSAYMEKYSSESMWMSQSGPPPDHPTAYISSVGEYLLSLVPVFETDNMDNDRDAGYFHSVAGAAADILISNGLQIRQMSYNGHMQLKLDLKFLHRILATVAADTEMMEAAIESLEGLGFERWGKEDESKKSKIGGSISNEDWQTLFQKSRLRYRLLDDTGMIQGACI